MRRIPLSPLAVTLGLACLAASGCRPEAPSAPRHVLLVSIDTLRRDHTTPYGYAHDTTPNLARLAASGVVFESAIAANTNTAPSHASIFTGRYPKGHGVRRNGDALAEGVTTLAERLGDGFARGGFVSGYPMQRKMTRLDGGFEVWDDDFGEDWQRQGDATVDRALAWLEARADEGRNVFLFVHLYDPHHPYDAPAPFATRFLPEGRKAFRYEGEAAYRRFWRGEAEPDELREYVARYDGEVAYADAQLGRLFEAWTQLGLWNDALVLVLSDHGETLDERAAPFTHGGRVYDEQARVPLLLRLPGDRHAGLRVATPVHHVDVMPTLLDYLEFAPAPGEVSDGFSMRRLVEASAPVAEERPLFTTALPQGWRVPEVHDELDPEVLVAAVRTPQWKLVAYPGVDGPVLHLFDLEADPGETRNAADERPAVRHGLWSQLQTWRGVQRAPKPNLTAEQEEALRALGYVD